MKVAADAKTEHLNDHSRAPKSGAASRCRFKTQGYGCPNGNVKVSEDERNEFHNAQRRVEPRKAIADLVKQAVAELNASQ